MSEDYVPKSSRTSRAGAKAAMGRSFVRQGGKSHEGRSAAHKVEWQVSTALDRQIGSREVSDTEWEILSESHGGLVKELQRSRPGITRAEIRDIIDEMERN